MSNLALFIHQFNNIDNYVYKLYKQITNKLLIFTDKCSINTANNIPIFSTFYIRNCFHQYYILVDINDIHLIPSIILNKCIVIHDGSNKMDNINCYLKLNINEPNINKIVEDKLYENI
jgi:hypothetical protein